MLLQAGVTSNQGRPDAVAGRAAGPPGVLPPGYPARCTKASPDSITN